MQERTHTCGELTAKNLDEVVTLYGWIHTRRDHGGLIFIDLWDKYGLTQVVLNPQIDQLAHQEAHSLRGNFVISVRGKVRSRPEDMINPKLKTGEIEVFIEQLEILNPSNTPPFTGWEHQEVGEATRLKHRYLDLRSNELQKNLELRYQITRVARDVLDKAKFIEIETPILTKSTPEGARDYLVPSRLNPQKFYALPQSPQLFKQILMVSGMDRYFQIVKCFRDEDLRADRQPEFTQIDCEMSFVEQEDILNTFENLTRHLLKTVMNVELKDFPRMTFDDAMRVYGNDKPDIRFDMKLNEINALAQNKGFKVFDDAELVLAINAKGCAGYTRKQLDKLTDWVKRPQIGAKGLIYVKCNEDGSYKSSVDKFFGQEDLAEWAKATNAEAGDLILVLSGDTNAVRKQMSELRLEMGEQLGLRDPKVFAPLWVIDFPLLEWDEESGRYHAMHHPFTSPKPEDLDKLDTAPGEVKANAYDMVLNGSEIGGGSIRIHDRDLQKLMFKHLGFTDEEALEQFGFLMNAFEYGAPPHGGLAFGLDRLCSIMGGAESIRDFIAFPKNNSGRDVMIDAPSKIDNVQLDELSLSLALKKS